MVDRGLISARLLDIVFADAEELGEVGARVVYAMPTLGFAAVSTLAGEYSPRLLRLQCGWQRAATARILAEAASCIM
jgi:hypothetical protein